ncbi:MAG: bifunctional GNAT family N-acetyltransferase/carbon-nitrogen hydrolase family protein [Spirochaeta sp.]|jgi:predicted amidohydrolase/ribosomal protein S18 acetylase RimI-like enzyme|nr:bifunctional GNAT family N-acetyltransferase/carbon-nitrogen hydrolase family protein [Spirochaeta sp.]
MNTEADNESTDLHHLHLRNLRMDDYPQIKSLMDRIYTDLDGAWPKSVIAVLVRRFPEAQFGIEDNGVIVAVALTVRVDYARFSTAHTYDELLEGSDSVVHHPDGDAMYGLDVFVDPAYRGYRLGRRLYDARKELCREGNFRAIIAGGRIPGYYKYAAELSPQAYIDSVTSREIHDPILTFQLNNGFQVKRVLEDYIPEDRKSRGNATLLEWVNIYYQRSRQPVVSAPKRRVRVGMVQWQMRRVASLEVLLEQVEFFVDAISDYQGDFCVFPEFFNAALMGIGDQATSITAVRALAEYTPAIRDALSHMAVTYNINIVGGSMPAWDQGEMYNVAYLFHRDGRVEAQYKLHITPQERTSWGIQGGTALRVFDTDAGKIGILVCYDVEFPELGRLMGERGMEILVVPFWTDTKNGYLRVRRTAQARAIENECYVAITGSVGNLPRVDNVDIQYSQSAVFSPSDFAFPHDGIMAESTPNTEMTLLVDLDLDKLTELRAEGSVTNQKDRRLDLYQVEWLGE